MVRKVRGVRKVRFWGSKGSSGSGFHSFYRFWVRLHEAATMGLASRALPAAEVLPAALAMAADIATNTAPLSVALSKRLLWEARSLDREAVGERETEYHHLVMGRPDALEGVMAFLERRAPAWSLAVPRDWPADVDARPARRPRGGRRRE